MTDRVLDRAQLVSSLQIWARELGFSQIGVAGVDLSTAEPGLLAWLNAGFHGEMHYMARHGLRRARPTELRPGTLSIVSARMDYLPRQTPPDWLQREWQGLQRPEQAQVALYARGRDYHKVLRQRLQALATRLAEAVGPLGHRVFTDSAPVLEAELATRSGLGWRGKHTLVLNREAGSMFFLGEIFLDLDLPPTPPRSAHCGSCQACIEVCPTRAIVAPGRLDARRCVSYLTIEHEGPIPETLRPLLGNRIFGCDDCQLVCPWNKFAQRAELADFDARQALHSGDLLTLWHWSPEDFLRHTQGSAIRRIGHERWRRNLAVAMGNALRHPTLPVAQAQALRAALGAAQAQASALLREHIDWALRSASAAPDLSAAPPGPATG